MVLPRSVLHMEEVKDVNTINVSKAQYFKVVFVLPMAVDTDVKDADYLEAARKTTNSAHIAQLARNGIRKSKRLWIC